jgi:hypothetical protein
MVIKMVTPKGVAGLTNLTGQTGAGSYQEGAVYYLEDAETAGPEPGCRG